MMISFNIGLSVRFYRAIGGKLLEVAVDSDERMFDVAMGDRGEYDKR